MKSTEAVYADAGVAYIETQRGNFHANDHRFNIEAIAHSLSMMCRFNGHTNEFYSVGSHSLMVSEIMEYFAEGDPLEGLLHDGTEAIIADVAAPWKQFLPDLQKFDYGLEHSLRQQFRLPLTKTAACKKADWIALFIEADALMPSRGAEFVDAMDLRPTAMKLRRLFPVDQDWPKRTIRMFVQRFHSLTSQPQRRPTLRFAGI